MVRTGPASAQSQCLQREALSLMERALELLDECDDALAVAPHLDLAVQTLRDVVRSDAVGSEGTKPI